MIRLLYVILGIALTVTFFSFVLLGREAEVLNEKRNLAIFTSFTSCIIGVHKFYKTTPETISYCRTISNYYGEVWSDE